MLRTRPRLNEEKFFAYISFVSPSPTQPNRFFVGSQYSIYYRRLKTLESRSEVRADYEILFLLDGTLTFKSEASTTIDIAPGQSLLLNPSSRGSVSGKGVETLLLSLTPAFISDHAVRMHVLGSGAMVVLTPTLIAGDERLQQLARELASELREEEPGGEIVVEALVEQMVVLLLRHYASMRQNHDLELSRAGLVDRRIRRSVELMHAQLAADLTLKEIAAASYLSTFHFARVFKKLAGTTPHAYLAAIRTARAQSLLTNAELSVSEISSLVGYSSPSHFTKAFRQSTGLTPRAFRQALVSR